MTILQSQPAADNGSGDVDAVARPSRLATSHETAGIWHIGSTDPPVDARPGDMFPNALTFGASITGSAPSTCGSRTGTMILDHEWEQFDFPTSLAFGAGSRDRQERLRGQRGCSRKTDQGPSVVRVGVVAGSRTH
jgi:hypothetical protein